MKFFYDDYPPIFSVKCILFESFLYKRDHCIKSPGKTTLAAKITTWW